MTTAQADLAERLAKLALFADVPKHELEELAAHCEEARFGEGQFVVRQGDRGHALYVILEGEAGVVIDDVERATLSIGGFFGEVALLLDEPGIADILTRTPLHCIVIPADEVEDFLIANPRVMWNMLRSEARRVRTATEWHS